MKYEANIDCQWIIRTKGRRKRILIQFETFKLESEPCYFDFLEIRDGEDKNSPLIAKKCGGELRGKRFYSTAKAFRIRFKTDKNIHKKGFHMKYKAVKVKKIIQKVKTTLNPIYHRRRDYFVFGIEEN
jgi:CUB domain.